MNQPADLNRCLVILLLRTSQLSQDAVTQILACHKSLVGSVEKWFSEQLPYLEAVELCRDEAVKRASTAELGTNMQIGPHELIKAAQITSDNILRHYRKDYLQKQIELEEKGRLEGQKIWRPDTAHELKMRELSEELLNEIRLPSVIDCLIPELKDGSLWLGKSASLIGHANFQVSVSKKGKEIEVRLSIEGEDETIHLYEGLLSHLETGGFLEVLHDIEDWKSRVAVNLGESHEFLLGVKKRIDKSFKVSIPIEDNGQHGFIIYFPRTICAAALEPAHYKDFSYRYEAPHLRFGAFAIYRSSTDEDLKQYEDSHRKLIAEYSKNPQAKEIAKFRAILTKLQSEIQYSLRKFKDMKKAPGHCQLCD